METKEEVRELYNTLLHNALGFYRNRSAKEGLGVKHLDKVLEGLFDKFIDAVFSKDVFEAKNAKEDLCKIFEIDNDSYFIKRIDFLRERVDFSKINI